MKHATPSLLLLLAGLLPLHAVDLPKDPPNREIPALEPFKAQRIDSLVPKTARATPKKAHLVLVCGRTEGYYHESIPLALHAVEALGLSTGAFKVEFNHEMSAFTAENLKRFDAVIFVNSTQLKFQNPENRKALLDFVHAGGGLVGIHAASDNFPGWPEGQALMGGVFHSHPWRSGDVVAVKLDEPEHVLNTAFGGHGFWIQEEIYQIVGAYGRDHQRVLMSLDMSRKENDRPADQFVRADRDFPIGWLKFEGAGRVFYSSLGHNDTTYYTPEVLQHFLDGIQFALGDLEAPAAPSTSLASVPAPALAPDDHHVLLEAGLLARIEQKDTIEAVVSYEPGKTFAPLHTAEAALRLADEAGRRSFEASLVDAATKRTPGAEARRQISKWLAWAGGDLSVPLLASWAVLPEAGDDAVRALGQIPGPISEKALSGLLEPKAGPLTVSLLNALSLRGSVAGVDAAKKLLTASERAIASAAIDYLALTPVGSDAGAALAGATLPPELEASRGFALVTLSRRSFASDAAWSHQTLKGLADGAKDAKLRRAAVFELLNQKKGEGLEETIPLIATFDEPMARSLAAAWVRKAAAVEAKGAIAALATAFPKFSKPLQTQILVVVEQLGVPAVSPIADAALALNDPEITRAAIRALGAGGRDEASADRLLTFLEQPDYRADAEYALGRLNCAGLEAKLEALASHTAPEKLNSVLTIAASRVDRAIMPFVLKAAATKGESRKTAFKALSSLVRGEDIPLLLDLRPDLKTAQEKRAWQDAFFTAIRFRSDRDAVAALIKAELPKAQDYERTTFVISLTLLDTPAAAEIIKGELADANVDRRKDIVRALSAARNLAAGDLLIAHVETAKDESEVILALRGYLATLSAFPEMNMPKKVLGYRRAWAHAARKEDQDAIRSTVERLWGPDALKFANELHSLQNKNKS